MGCWCLSSTTTRWGDLKDYSAAMHWKDWKGDFLVVWGVGTEFRIHWNKADLMILLLKTLLWLPTPHGIKSKCSRWCKSPARFGSYLLLSLAVRYLCALAMWAVPHFRFHICCSPFSQHVAQATPAHHSDRSFIDPPTETVSEPPMGLGPPVIRSQSTLQLSCTHLSLFTYL